MILSDVISPIATIAPVVPLTEVTDEQLARYADLIYRRTGIRVAPQKKTLLSNRVRRRLRETGIAGFDEYYEHLKRLTADDPEWDEFLQEITTHETYLFRDENHWEWFRGTYLPQCAAEARAGSRPCSLRIWSAASSTGDEAFTAACCIAACLPNFQQWQIRILGTDIGVGAVAQAKAARFSERAMRLVPEAYKGRFFSKDAQRKRVASPPGVDGDGRFPAAQLAGSAPRAAVRRGVSQERADLLCPGVEEESRRERALADCRPGVCWWRAPPKGSAIC